MNQKLSDLASLAEIVSGIAVVVTLIFLIIGIRENTTVTRASMYQRSTEQLLDWRNRTIDDPEITRLFQAFLDSDYEDVTEIGELRLRQLIVNAFSIYEQAYYAEQYGVMGASEWSRFEGQICNFYDLVQAFPALAADFHLLMTQEFAAFTENLCTL